MYLCYIDESGTSALPGNTSHFVLAGLSIPIWMWKSCEADIKRVKSKFGLADAEIHTGWIIRSYIEQNKIAGFEKLLFAQRRVEIEKYRKTELLRLQKSPKTRKAYLQAKKNFQQTDGYAHLTLAERRAFVLEIAKTIGNWGHARLFAECVDKVHFSPSKISKTVDEQAFEQIVSRFEQYLKILDSSTSPTKNYGLLIHDNNQTVAKRHTEMMKHFHSKGTVWTHLSNIIETPLFVDSQLTSMIQIADVCAYAIRRYLENGEETLFDEVFKRADTKKGVVVGVRHFTNSSCKCKICQGHRLRP